MKKGWIFICLVGLLVTFGSTAFAETPIKLIVNGEEVQQDLHPQIISGMIMVPIESINVALNLEVQWDQQNHTLSIANPGESREQVVASLPGADVTLYAKKYKGDYEQFKVQMKDCVRSFPYWHNESNFLPQIYFSDLNGDGRKELTVILTTGHGTGVYDSEVHVLTEDLSEVYVEDAMPIVLKNVKTQILPTGVEISIGDKQTMIAQENIAIEREKWYTEVGFTGVRYFFDTENQQLKAAVPATLSIGGFLGEVQITYTFKDKMYQAQKVEFLLSEEITEDDLEISKSAAGGWTDVNAEELIEEIYKKRENNPGRVGVEW
ncbi:stalk domain-containing protein [Desulforamulus ruminis]|uniref:Copper amine oxidase-like domain-containing protein n=1 Tax=Desulforamulus ruminis (strain ATCC 23193 / DSM 2154 / NCIMB 8452 / DL) TaxID=696281 RepID=F6DSK0_DESRL|nr:stalk domain-containing protein [Desulforamulus ruminis]AEG61090.1 copper amine oxidase-like domain-containing protein [Desulforamulus ruminis DSM 2154]